jgi:hypothetical protein
VPHIYEYVNRDIFEQHSITSLRVLLGLCQFCTQLVE